MNPKKDNHIDKSNSAIKDMILSDINTLKEKVSYTSNQLSFLKESEKDYWNKLLDSNIRAGTMACMWCIKTQLIKKISLAFNHWKILTAKTLPRSYHNSASTEIYGTIQLNKEDNKEIDALVAAMKLLKKTKDDKQNATLIESFSFDEMKDNTLSNFSSSNEQKRNVLLALSKNIISKLNRSPATSHKRSPSISSNSINNSTKNDIIHRTSLGLLKGNRKNTHRSPPVSTTTIVTSSSSQRSVNKPITHHYLQYKPTNRNDSFNVGTTTHTTTNVVVDDENTVGRFLSDLQEEPPPPPLPTTYDESIQTPYKDDYYNRITHSHNAIYADGRNIDSTLPPPPPIWSDHHPYSSHLSNNQSNVTTSSSEYNRNSNHKNIPRYLQATRSTIKKINCVPNIVKVNNKLKSTAQVSKPIIASSSSSNMKSSNSYSNMHDLNDNNILSYSYAHHYKYHSNNTSMHENTNTDQKIVQHKDNHPESKHSTSVDILFSTNQSSDVVYLPKDMINTNHSIDINRKTYYQQPPTVSDNAMQSVAQGGIYNYMDTTSNDRDITHKSIVNNKIIHDKISSSISNNINNKQNKHIDKAQLKLFFGDLTEDQIGSSKYQWTKNLRK